MRRNFMMRKLGKRSGFSLIEMVIYVTLLTLITTSIVSVLLRMTGSWATIRVDQSINYSAASAFERMTREIHSASSIATGPGQSVFNVDPGMLVLNTMDDLGTPTVLIFSVVDHRLTVGKGFTGVREPLTETGVSVTKLVFNHVVTPRSEAVRIEMQLTGSSTDVVKTFNFYTASSLRGAYHN